MSGHGKKCKTTIFTSHGGEVVKNGKGNYPDHLVIELTPNDAWDVVTNILSSLRRGQDPEVTLLGKLEECEDE